VLFMDNTDGRGVWQCSLDPLSIVYDREPVYTLEIDTHGDNRADTFEGNPYYSSSQVMWGHYYHGQRVVMDKRYGTFVGDNMVIGAIEFFARTEGDPGKVHVRLGGITEATLVPPFDIPDRWGWVRATLPAPVRLWENETYDLHLLSPSSDDANFVDVRTLKTSWAERQAWQSASYGGMSSFYLYSWDGSRWGDKGHRDTLFRFVTGYRGSDNFLSGVYDAGQVVDWQFIEWDATRPPGTTVNFWIRVGHSPRAGGAGWGAWQGPFTSRASLTALPNTRYAQYKIKLTTDGRRAPAVHEVRVGYRGGFGSLRIEQQNRFAGQPLIYEGGAVIVAQGDRSTMYRAPQDMIVPTRVSDNRLRLDINYRIIRAVGTVRSTALATMGGVKFYTLEDFRVTRSGIENTFTFMVISSFPDAWYEYLSRVASNIRRMYPGNPDAAHVHRDFVNPDTRGQVRLIIQGPGVIPGDIEFTERSQEIYARIL
jgi:hypothetical protein